LLQFYRYYLLFNHNKNLLQIHLHKIFKLHQQKLCQAIKSSMPN